MCETVGKEIVRQSERGKTGKQVWVKVRRAPTNLRESGPLISSLSIREVGNEMRVRKSLVNSFLLRCDTNNSAFMKYQLIKGRQTGRQAFRETDRQTRTRILCVGRGGRCWVPAKRGKRPLYTNTTINLTSKEHLGRCV